MKSGFSKTAVGNICLRIDATPKYPHVTAQDNDPNSLLNYVRKLLALRAATHALVTRGDWKAISDVDKPYPFAYMRWIDGEQYMIALNPSGNRAETEIELPQGVTTEWIDGTTNKFQIKHKHGKTYLRLPAVSAVICKINN